MPLGYSQSLGGNMGAPSVYADPGQRQKPTRTWGTRQQLRLRGYSLPWANLPNVSSCTVIISGPFVWPAMIGLFGTVS